MNTSDTDAARRDKEDWVCNWLRAHPGALRREILDAMAAAKRGKPSKTAAVLSALVASGRIVRVDAPDRQGLHILKEQRGRVRWLPVVMDEPQTTTKGEAT